MSRQLESLRSREVWLHGQVDCVTGVKDGVLAAQEESLHRALGALHGALNVYPAGQNNKLAQCLDR